MKMAKKFGLVCYIRLRDLDRKDVFVDICRYLRLAAIPYTSPPPRSKYSLLENFLFFPITQIRARKKSWNICRGGYSKLFTFFVFRKKTPEFKPEALIFHRTKGSIPFNPCTTSSTPTKYPRCYTHLWCHFFRCLLAFQYFFLRIWWKSCSNFVSAMFPFSPIYP